MVQTCRFFLTGGYPEPPTWASVSLCSQWDHSHLCTPKLTDLQLRPHFSTSLHSTTPKSGPYSLSLLRQLLPALNSLHSGHPPLSRATLSSSQRWLPTPRPAACPHLTQSCSPGTTHPLPPPQEHSLHLAPQILLSLSASLGTWELPFPPAPFRTLFYLCSLHVGTVHPFSPPTSLNSRFTSSGMPK